MGATNWRNGAQRWWSSKVGCRGLESWWNRLVEILGIMKVVGEGFGIVASNL